MRRSERLDAEYVLPIRWTIDTDLPELTAYLSWLSGLVDVTIVDGSPVALYQDHKKEWSPFARHMAPEPWPGRNRKVAGVMTGVRLSRHEKVILADDDVRYDQASLTRLARMLDVAAIVRPQNYFHPQPWHAQWDTARTLVNRALGADYPGTFGVRRSVLLDAGGYNGDVLFENLELIRTVRAAGGQEIVADDLFVARTPAKVRHFFDQRVRQAYDDFAQPVRLCIELAMLPLILVSVRRPKLAIGLTVAVCALAEFGRRTAGGRAVFPATSVLWAPVWLAERALCVWAALWLRLNGGVHYAGHRILQAGTSQAAIKRHLDDEMKKRMAQTHDSNKRAA